MAKGDSLGLPGPVYTLLTTFYLVLYIIDCQADPSDKHYIVRRAGL